MNRSANHPRLTFSSLPAARAVSSRYSLGAPWVTRPRSHPLTWTVPPALPASPPVTAADGLNCANAWSRFIRPAPTARSRPCEVLHVEPLNVWALVHPAVLSALFWSTTLTTRPSVASARLANELVRASLTSRVAPPATVGAAKLVPCVRL